MVRDHDVVADRLLSLVEQRVGGAVQSACAHHLD